MRDFRRLLRGDRAHARGHHAARAHAGAHGERTRIEDIQAGDEARHQRHEQRADHGAGDVLGHHAAAFRRIHAVALADDGQAGLAAHREGGADGFALDTQQQRQRQADDHGAEEMPELLEHQGPAGFAYLRQGPAYHQAQLSQERQQRVLQVAADAGLHGGVDAGASGQALAEGRHDRADEDGPQHRLQNDLARAHRERDAADRFRNDHHQ
ncbi:hypothetical protein FQZ97_803120 [compost metagenome]